MVYLTTGQIVLLPAVGADCLFAGLIYLNSSFDGIPHVI